MDEIGNLLLQGAKRVQSDPALRDELAEWNRKVVIRVPSVGEYTVTVSAGKIDVAAGSLEGATVLIVVDRETLRSVASKKTSLAMAYLDGRIKVKGDATLADFRKLQRLV